MRRLKRFLQPDRLEAGVDEAGRGALAGPVVAAAVILPPDLKPRGITDSKLLNAATRYRLRDHILRHAICWHVGIVDVATIDRINIFQAAMTAMHEAIDGLGEAPAHLLVDGHLFRPHRLPHTCCIKGDGTYLSIAAASILAKTFRDDIMRNLAAEYPLYGWDQNMGYPTPAHRQAIQTHGASPWHRTSFQVRLPQLALFA